MNLRTLVAAAFALSMLVPTASAAHDDGLEEGASYVVGFSDQGASPRAGERLHGARVVATEPALGFAVVHAANPHAFEAQARRDSGIRYVEADPLLPLLSLAPDDPRFGEQYGPPLVGAPAAWDTTLGATAVTLCVVDTGVRYTHEDLAPRYAGGYDFVNNDADPWDDHGHGTHASGIAAAAVGNGKGVAGMANVALKHAKALDASGQGSWSRVASAIRWCADQGAATVSLSLGGTSGSTALKDAVDYAWAKGAVVVAASGNNGCDDCVMYPAKYANAMAVGCVSSTKSVCSFSNRGAEIEVVAPGSGVLATYHRSDGDYVRMSGTSMSTPHVAGAAALLKSANPAWTNVEIRDALRRSAEDLGPAGWDSASGHGLLRVDRALALLQPAAPAPAPAPALGIASLHIAPSAPTHGDDVAFEATVENRGSGAASAFVVRFTLDGALHAEVPVAGLAAGASVDVAAPWRATEGAHALTLTADAATASLAFEVAPAPAPAPEPTPEPRPEPTPDPTPEPPASAGVTLAADAASQTVSPRGTVVYRIVVTNTGDAQDEVRLTVAGELKGGWKATLGRDAVSLAPGESQVVELTVGAPNKRGATLYLTVTGTSSLDPGMQAAVETVTRVA